MAHLAEDISMLSDSPHWTVHHGRATFAPASHGWRAVITRLNEPTARRRFHVAIADNQGTTRYTSEAATLDEAVRSAERGVLARNALRLVRRVS
jgi:hypothetical protein